MHTTFSDGAYEPAELVDLARRSGLSAIAITDHDTLGAIAPARQLAGDSLTIVSGVEITTEFCGHELHLLGYFFDPDNSALGAALERLSNERLGRFHEMIGRLDTLGVHIEEEHVAQLQATTTLGRRHLAELIVKAKKAATVREAFQRYLGDRGRATVPKTRLPVAEAIALVRGAAGVASWAHPLYDCTIESMRELKDLGLGAVEAEYPSFRASKTKALRQWATELGLAITGGSDCHGPDQPHRALGVCSISHDELQILREMI